jgi:hypothetical protein
MFSGNFGLNALGRLAAVLLVVVREVMAQDFLDLRIPELEVTHVTRGLWPARSREREGR